MATISLTIPDAQATRILAAYCGLHGYQEIVSGPPDAEGLPTTIPNPQTRLEFMKQQIYIDIKRAVVQYEAVEAQRLAIIATTTEIIIK